MTEGTKQPVPQFPGGPDPEQPVPRDPVHGVDLSTCAAIAAQLAARREQRRTILGRHRMDEARWGHVEQTWMLRVASAAMRGDLSLSEEYDAAFATAQDALGGADIDLETMAAIVARIESGRPADIAMHEEGVDTTDFARAQRKFAPRLAASPELFAAFRAAVEERRRAL